MTVSPRLRKLLPLMALSFSFFAATGSLSPFLSLQLRTVGLSDEEAVLVTTAAAFTSLLGPVLVGLVAERRRAYRSLLVLSLVLAAAGYSALLAVPRVVRSPRSPLLEFDCPSGLYLERCPEWDACTASELNPLGLATFRVSNCHYQCGGNRSVRQPIHFCFLSHEGNLCIIHEAGTRDNSTTEFGASFLAKTARTLADVSVSKFIEHQGRSGDELVDVCSFDLLAPIVVNQKQFNDYECRPHPEGCTIRCSVAVADNLGRRMQSARCIQVEGDPQLTFWATLALRVFADLWLITALYLVEAVTVLAINDFTGLYGRIKFWAALGVALSAPVTGVLVDSELSDDYSPAVLLFDGLALVSCVLALFLPAVEDNKVNLHYGLGEEPRFCSLDTSVLFLIVLVLGTVWGYLETYLHWMYAEMGATHLLVALSLALPMGCALPFLAIAKNLVRNIGRANLIVFGFLFYATRAAGLSFVTARWWITPFEAMETFTLPVLWVALVAYAQKVVPSNQRLTVQCILIILHFCIGRGTGTIAGFFLNASFGRRTTLRGVAVVCAGAGLLYLFLYHTCLRKIRLRRQSAAMPATINGGWYPMQNCRANGDTPAHRPMMGDQDDSDTGGFEDCRKN